MPKRLVLCGVILALAFVSAIPCVAGPCTQSDEAPGIYVPDRGCFELGVGYQYQGFRNVYGTNFNNQSYNVNFTAHLFDWLTGAEGRLAAGGEVALTAGFDGKTNGIPSLDAKSLFAGGGPHLSVPNRSRFEPWAHVLFGVEHLRFTQGPVLGSNSAFAFLAGGGVDIRLAPRVSWRVEGDYLGTDFQSRIQSNYVAGTGLVFSF